MSEEQGKATSENDPVLFSAEGTMTVQQPTPQSGLSAKAIAWWHTIEHWLTKTGDRLNPILVKETRQAIKSRQFTLTFILVLAAAWVVTIGGVTFIGPGVFYSSRGSEMFWAYFIVLAFPLAVIVPYSAYRSLAAEQEENTFELLSISNLSPRQIISGKLGSAFVQMLVYLSAVAPCLAFTYLLRGIDVLTIVVLISYAVLASLGLCMIGLLFATSAKKRYGQVVLSVALVIGLVVCFFMGIGAAQGILTFGNLALDSEGFWTANAAGLTLYTTTFALLFLAGAAQITFKSDNRSTPIRIAMLVQQACFLGWIGYGFIYGIQESNQAFGPGIGEMVVVTAMLAGIYWYIMGTMLTAEWPVLSRRVQRSLPQSTMGRLFFTWLNPGPGTGYVFAIATLLAIVVIGFGAMIFLPAWFDVPAVRSTSIVGVYYFLIIGFAYITLYLGVGKLLVDVLRRFSNVPIAGSMLINMFLIAAGCFIPAMIQMASSSMRTQGYSMLHATNPFWSLIEIVDTGTMSTEATILVFLVPFFAIIVFLLNFRGIAREVRYRRTTLPNRLLEEEAILHPPEPAKPTSPWYEV